MEKKFPLKEYKPLPGFGLGYLWKAGKRHPRANVVLTSAMVLCLLLAATSISFESELKNLQPRSSEAFLSQEKVEQHLSVSPKQLVVAIEGNDLADVLSQGGRVDGLAHNLLKKDEIVSFSSLGQVINGASEQRHIVQMLSSSPDRFRLEAGLRDGLTRQGFAIEPFHDYLQRLAKLANAHTLSMNEGIAQLSNSPFRGIIERHLFRDESGYHLLTYLNYRGPEFQQKSFLAELQRIAPHYRATSVDLVSGQLIESVSRSFVLVTIIGSVMVLLLLSSHFNSPAGVFYSLFPVTCGGIGMLGLMALSGMRLNFMNVLVLVTILGMGSDYGLHIAHRVRNCSDKEHMDRFIQSGRAVLLSALSTIAGFGSLAFTDYGALASIGWATNFGIAATTLFTLWSLPAFMTYLRSKAIRRV